VKLLAVGAHPDDIELGCGATLARFGAAGAQIAAVVMTDGSLGPSGYDSRRQEAEAAAGLLGARLHWGGWVDGMLPVVPESISWLEDIVKSFKPDLVFTHTLNDSHQDHIATARIVLAAARGLHQVLHFETPSTLEFSPTVFCDVSHSIDAKLDALRCHLSQVVGAPRVDLEAVEAQLRFRGFQGRLRYAEAFEPSRCLLGDALAVEQNLIDLSDSASADSPLSEGAR
jgi:LmbE family N-acetylglucosaminyl deacetylase